MSQQLISEKESFNKMVLLTGARVFGVIFSFIIPMYLGRHLDIEIYGTYKQILFVFWLSQIALNFGFDDSVYYYFRTDKKNFALYGINALVFNLSVTSVLAIIMTVFRNQIGNLLNNPHLPEFIPLLGVLIILTVSSLQIEGYLLNLNRFKTRLILDAGTELLKSLSILSAFIFFNSIYMVLVFLCLIMFARMLWAIAIIHEYKIKDDLKYIDSLQFLKKQARFALPLGASRILQNILNLETLFISSFFSLVQYTFYSVGCFDNPIINSMRTSLYELVNIELVENIKSNNFEKAADTWRRMTRKLYLVALPFTVFMMVFSTEVVTFIFSDKYIESAPFFIVYNFYILISALNPEPLFRATSKTGYALKIRMIGVLLGIGFIISAAYWIGPMAVLWGKLIAIAFINLTGLVIGSKLIKTKISKMFLWQELLKILIISALLAFSLKYCISVLDLIHKIHLFWILAFSFSSYVLFIFLLSSYFNILKQDETAYIQLIFKKICAKIFFFRS